MDNKNIDNGGPLVSVIIPTYGRNSYISNAVNSVCNQTYRNIEIIIVDDNGLNTKNQQMTEVVVKSIKNPPFPINYIALKNNMGGAYARNVGIETSKGDYIAFLDDDDEFLPQKIELQIEKLTGSKSVACYCSHIKRNNKTGFSNTNILSYSGDLTYKLMTFSIDACGGSSLLIDRNTLDKMGGFSTNLKRMQDYEFIIRLSCEGRMEVVSEPCLLINVHDGSYIHKTLKEFIDTRREFRKIIEPCYARLTSRQKRIAHSILDAADIDNAIRFKEYKTALKLIIGCKYPIHSIYFAVIKRIIRVCKRKLLQMLDVNKNYVNVYNNNIPVKCKK